MTALRLVAHERAHVQHGPHTRATPVDEPTIVQRAGIPTERRDADQLRDLAARQAPELRKICEEREREHGADAPMFGRRPSPRLALVVPVVSRGVTGGGPEEYWGYAVVNITNTGRGSARSPYLAITVPPPYFVSWRGVDDPSEQSLARQMRA